MASAKSKTPPQFPPTPKQIGHWLFDFFNSFGLASLVLLFLTIITLLGTLNQVEESLFDSQKKYFESFWITDTLGGFPISMPGGALLMGILFINLTLGMILKIRKNWKAVGLYVSHFGIIVLIVSAWVTQRFSWEGNMALYPGMESNEVLSYHDWQLEVLPIDETGRASEALVIPKKQLLASRRNNQVFTAEQLPFHLELSGYQRNAWPVPASAPIAADGGEEIDGFVLLGRAPEKEAERNTAGVYASFTPKEGVEGTSEKAIIWAHVGGNFMDRIPHIVEFDGKRFGIQMVRERMSVPFTVKLDEFIFEKYGGTTTAKNYQSNITKIEGDTAETIEIKMNEPMRHRGFTFFQASFGPADAGPDEELYTQFAVVRNPSDHWPLVSMIIVFAGLLFHLLLKLSEHLNRSAKSSRGNSGR